ncbi:hypothetical protein [Pseudoxanthomonas sp.]|uniref:hypothetical protein n=1 Tax=Pseudoxanthomonas sp. TaxID=1871049 RepID=UPI0025E1C9F9|nr:hypothetical protein [Pseudoxanthomonas sp.]
MYRNAARAAVITGPWQTPAPAAAKPRAVERRKAVHDADALRVGLTPAQLMTLEAMEIFHWRLAFVRRPLFQAPIPVLFDRGDTRYVVIEEDGTLNENPTLVLRA